MATRTDATPKSKRRRRIAFERIEPQIDAGRYPIKRILGDEVVFEVDLFADGHDVMQGQLLYRHEDSAQWTALALEPLVNDRWRAKLKLSELGRWYYSFAGWIDEFATWQHGFGRKVEANQDVDVDILVGTQMVERAVKRSSGKARTELQAAQKLLATTNALSDRISAALNPDLREIMNAAVDKNAVARHEQEFEIVVDRALARFSSWYEMFPRSCGKDGKHGTFRDAEERLPYIGNMGFDVLYLPPIHPIGHSHRKGPNNSLVAGADAVGCPWAIGSEQGGHKSIHPELGTLDDFRRFRKRAETLGLELALDVALQASPDHPYVREHPEWFRHRPDGTIQYAENPPKKYQDIYPFDFECDDWQAMWDELLSIFLFWVDEGIRIFRVDNPHTKALNFWEWCIREIKRRQRDVIFLAEAFTRPKLMYNLAKVGFTQSYTYFTWRYGRNDMAEYLTELTRTEVAQFFRPNFWPNTPDILPEHLQHGGRSTFISRLVLASMLSGNYGIYGPPFELMEHVAREGSEEYVDNEKYQLRDWPIYRDYSLRDLIARLNTIRKQNPALHTNDTLRFHATDNEAFICFSKTSPRDHNSILVVVNVDPYHRQAGWLQLNLEALGTDPHSSYQVHDLITNSRYLWTGPRNFVELDPQSFPAHIFRVRHKMRTEHNFDYFG